MGKLVPCVFHEPVTCHVMTHTGLIQSRKEGLLLKFLLLTLFSPFSLLDQCASKDRSSTLTSHVRSRRFKRAIPDPDFKQDEPSFTDLRDKDASQRKLPDIQLVQEEVAISPNLADGNETHRNLSERVESLEKTIEIMSQTLIKLEGALIELKTQASAHISFKRYEVLLVKCSANERSRHM